MSEKKQEEEFHFLQESPLNSEQSVEFGHRDIIATLTNIVCHTDHNLTIGLFGSWGTGKSTIVEVLKSDLKEKKIPVIIFDVWKHEGDALRRTFLKELDEQLSKDEYGENYIGKLNILNERVYVSASAVSETYKFLTGKIWRHLVLIALIGAMVLFALFLVRGFVLLFLDADIFNKTTIPTAGSLFASVLAGGLLFKYLDSFIKTEKKDIKQDKFQDPHEFETEFGKLIGNLREDKKKIVITFDNLDRISGDNALKVIATIKTFLDFRISGDKTVFFLIPCDVMAMKNHILAPLGNQTGEDKNMYVEEFLRKFFNTAIWIPEFYDTELENFASTKLAETGIGAFCDDYLAWLILKVFNQNPRQIIQFINQLLANYLLLKEVCNNNGLSDKSFYKNNVPQLAKFLLLKQKFPEQIEQYRKTNTYLLSDTLMLQHIKSDAFNLFINQTADIHIASLEPFFRYKTSRHEQKIPGINKLFSLLTAEDENAKVYATELKLLSYQDDFNSLLKTYMKPISNPVIKVKFINSVLQLASDTGLQLSNSIKRDIINTLLDTSNGNLIHHIRPDFVTTQLLKSSPVTVAEKNNVISSYYKILVDDDTSKESGQAGSGHTDLDRDIYLFIRDNHGFLTADLKSTFDSYLAYNFSNPDVGEIFVNDRDTQKNFITFSFRKKVIDAAVDPATKKFDTLCIIFDLLDNFEPKSVYVDFILHLFNTYLSELFNLQTISNNRTKVLHLLIILSHNLNADQIKDANTKYFPTEDDRNLFKGKSLDGRYNISETSILNHIFMLFNNIEADGLSDFAAFLKVAYVHESGATRVETALNRLLYNNPTTGLDLIRQQPFDINKVIFQNETSLRTFIDLFLFNDGFMEGVQAALDVKFFVELIIDRIGASDYKTADQYLHEYRNRLIPEDLERIGQGLLERLKNYKGGPGQDLKDLLQMIRFVKDNDLNSLSFADFWQIITGFLMDDNAFVQENGYRLYRENLEHSDRSIGKDVAEYLIMVLVTQNHKNHYYAHEVVTENRKLLSKQYLDVYLQYLYQYIFSEETAANVLEACIPFIAENKYDIMAYEEEINDILFRTRQIKKLNKIKFEQYQKILLPVQKRLKKIEHNVQTEDLIERITDILK